MFRKKSNARPRKRTPEVIENVRQIVEHTPKISTRHLGQQVNLSHFTCNQILRKDLGLYPYRLTSVQQLLPTDYPTREEFSRWFLATMTDDILNRTFFSDEAWFHLSGYVNSQNMRMWSAENPHFFVETPLHPQKIGVWVGLSRRRLVGPIFFNGTLTAQRYREEILNVFIQQMHDDELHFGYFQQDGATAHAAQATILYLQEFYDHRLISRNTENPWPTRSCDLTPLDFFLWPHLKNSIFTTPINNLQELTERITTKCEEINNSPELLQRVIDGVKRRSRLCIQEGGAHFQHLL